MGEFPRVELQNTTQLLKERKAAVTAARAEAASLMDRVKQVSELFKQNKFYEKEIAGARGRIFMLMLAQLRQAEVTCSEEFLAQLEESVGLLAMQSKKATQE